MTTAKHNSIFLNGKIIQARDEFIQSLAPGVARGPGVFETMRVYRGVIFALDEHFKRLFRGLRLLKIHSPYSQKQLRQHLDRTIKRNGLSEARIRLAVWKDKQVHIAIVGQALSAGQIRKFKRGFIATLSTVKRKKTRYSSIKSMDYGDFRKAFEKARQKGFDEAILLNNRREIVEGSRTNIFFIKKGIIYTPCIRSGCLNGVTRQIILREARQLGFKCKAINVPVSKLIGADEAFVTNSLIGVVPLARVDSHFIGKKPAGTITKKLQQAYNSRIHSCPA